MRAVAAALEPDTFQKRRPEPSNAETVDCVRLTEVGFETRCFFFLGLDGRHCQNVTRFPIRFGRRRLNKEVSDFLAGRVVEPQIAGAACQHRRHFSGRRIRDARDDPEWTRSAEQRHVDG